MERSNAVHFNRAIFPENNGVPGTIGLIATGNAFAGPVRRECRRQWRAYSQREKIGSSALPGRFSQTVVLHGEPGKLV
jgi:hypothetical protein